MRFKGVGDLLVWTVDRRKRMGKREGA